MSRQSRNLRDARTSNPNYQIGIQTPKVVPTSTPSTSVNNNNNNNNNLSINGQSKSPANRFIGYGKGIQGYNNSCYLDSTLMALFYKSFEFDKVFLTNSQSQSDQIQMETSANLRLIVERLRNTGFCPSDMTGKLRHTLVAINPKLNGEMMDVDELLSTLCGKALKLSPFLHYKSGTSNYYHQLVLSRGSQSKNKIGRLQELLEQSLTLQGLEMRAVPSPGLLVKMPRSNGRLIGYDGIIPSLTVNIPGTGGTLELQSVICLRHCHYTCFIRFHKEWLYYDSMAAGGQPEVTSVENMEHHLHDIQNQDTLAPLAIIRPTITERMLHQLISDVHFCVYTMAIARPPPRPTTASSVQVRERELENSQRMSTPRTITTSRVYEWQSHSAVATTSRVSKQVQGSSRINTPSLNSGPIPVNQHNQKGHSGIPQFFEDLLTGIKSMWTHVTTDLNNSMQLIRKKRRLTPAEIERVGRLGQHRGVELSSKYPQIGPTLFCILSNTRVNDSLFLNQSMSSDPCKRQIAILLEYISIALRFPPYYCRVQLIEELNNVLSRKTPKLSQGSFDIDEFMSILFQTCLQVQPFIKYLSGSSFIHHLIVPQQSSLSQIMTTQVLFELSMRNQKLRLDSVPTPQLILKVPRLKGHLVGYKYVFPSLTLDLTNLIKNMVPVQMDLFAVICLKGGNSFVSYVRYNSDQQCEHSCWIKQTYKNKSTEPTVVAWPTLHQYLLDGPSGGRLGKDKDDMKFLELCSNVHICFYKSLQFQSQLAWDMRGRT